SPALAYIRLEEPARLSFPCLRTFVLSSSTPECCDASSRWRGELKAKGTSNSQEGRGKSGGGRGEIAGMATRKSMKTLNLFRGNASICGRRSRKGFDNQKYPPYPVENKGLNI